MSSEDLSNETLEFELKLQKLRSQITSKLDNQKHLALVLSAVEENISADQNNQNSKSPVAYFVSFLALLEQSINSDTDEILDQKLAYSASYLLDLVLPSIPKALLRSKFAEILTKLAPGITNSSSEAPLIKSSIGSLETLLIAQDLNSWNDTSLKITPKRGFGGLLEFSLDPRPKVRKRALEAINRVLSTPPPGPALEHPAAASAVDFALNNVVTLLQNKPNQKTNKEHSAQLIHSLKLISSIASANTWPTSKFEVLCDLLLKISKTNDQYLVAAAFNGFTGLFNSMTTEIDHDKFVKVLNIIFDLRPSVNDSNLAAAWIAVVAKGISSYSNVEPLECLKKLPQVFKILKTFFASEISDISISASQCLISIFSEAIPDELLLLPAKNGVSTEVYEDVDDVISNIAEPLTELLSVEYAHSTKEILEVFTAAFDKLRSRANPDFLEALKIIGEWRTNEEFEFISGADSVIGSAICHLGPETVLSVLPLNLLDSKKEGRAWLLPLLRDNIRFARLGFFIEHFIPLIKTFQAKVDSSNKESVHFKIFKTIIDQIWSLLPHFADLPSDLAASFTDEFAQELASLLYSNVERRVNICHSLKMLVDSNVAFANGALANDLVISQQFTVEEAKQNIESLSGKAPNLLAVLFNVFSQTAPESRGFVLETIDAYLKITKSDELQSAFNKVSVLLKQALDNESQENPQDQQKGAAKLSATMMDLIVAMAKYLPESSHNALFTIFNQSVASKDPLLQKRSYRIISKMVESPGGSQALVNFVSSIESVLIESSSSVHISARASRLSAISTILSLLPTTDLYFIPSILSEMILATKDVNEKTRQLSFKILIDMGRIMLKGGIVTNSKIPGFDKETPDSEANLSEFFTMVSAGLAGSAAHMISATITAISCLVYEFKDDISTELLVDVSSTVELFLTSNNREIVKSTIGFVKIAAISLPQEIVEPNLRSLLANLLRWSHEHTGHFKSKVKHIIERLIRRFGIEVITENFPEDDRKLLTNIRKSKARAKRRQTELEEEQTADTKPLRTSYEDVIYDSDSEEGSSDEEDTKGKSKKSAQFILESKDQPLDLLDPQALSNISSSRPKKSGNRKIDASRFEQNGKLHFSEGDSNRSENDPLSQMTSGINAYVEAVKSGPIKGQKNKFKFRRGAKAADDNGFDNDEEIVNSRPQKSGRGNFGNGNRIAKPKNKFKARKKF